jgi:N-acetylglucosamine-6-phosphate deacetylase
MRRGKETSTALRGRILLGHHLEPGTVIVRDGRIESVQRGLVSDGSLPAEVVDAPIISPGMIDLQVNGAIGLEVRDRAGDIDEISRWMPGSGVTAWLPTIVTAAADLYPRAFGAWNEIDLTAGAVPLGLHLEGPFLSPARKGAHQLRYIEAATDELFASWLDQEAISLVTLAPEREGAQRRIRQLVERGIIVSLGHTNATYEQFLAGIDAGASKATHLFNAMSPVHHRAPGAMVAAMLDDRVTTGIIPDAVHAHPAMIRLAIETKSVDRIVVVSDMMTATGLGPGTYGLSGQTVLVDDTSARLEDGTLAGSILTMDAAIRNVVEWGGASAAEALHMATAVPARLIGDTTRGEIVPGKRADLTLWTDDLQVTETLIAGRRFAASEG